jgi:hypothetical protein
LIYVKRDPALIPDKVLKVAERAQQKLETLPEAERKDFIEKKKRIWRSFARYLSKMSYGKCWYSESNDPQSFFDVDHFRPKKEAKRSESESDDGYPWLAFSWENFRYSAGRSNRLSTDDETEEVVGKGSWFPLLQGSVKADWNNRCEAQEKALLLDPTVRADVDLIAIGDDGRACQSFICVGPIKQVRVTRSIEIYGLNLPNLVTARRRVIRQINENHQNLMDILTTQNDMPAIERLTDQLRRATLPEEPYSLAARCALAMLSNGVQLSAQPEDHL